MAQQNINFGTFPDDPDADAIRTAFNKVQQNFTEVYNAGAGASVTSINRNPGAGITVNNPTGNVIVTANIACVQVSTSTLSIGVGSNGGTTAALTASSQTLVIDLPGNITNVANLTLSGYLSVTGNANVGNLGTAGIITSTGNITGGNLVTGGLITSTGNITGGNVVTGGVISSIGNANVGNLGTGGLITATGNIRGANLVTPGVLSVTGNANVGNIGATAGVFTGAITGSTTASITGNANVGNLGTAGLITATGNVTGANLVGPLASGNSNISITSNANITMYVAGNTTARFTATTTGVVANGTFSASGNSNVGNLGTAGLITASGNLNAGNIITGGIVSSTGNANVGNLGTGGLITATGNITSTATLVGNVVTANYELIGPAASANLTRFPNALAVVSNTAAGIQQNEPHNIGLMAEGTANSANSSVWGVGLYGVGYTAGGTRSGGVIGEAHVSASADTASAIGVRGYSNDTHSGGFNIGLYADANGSSTGNYALYMNTGNIVSANTQTWSLIDNNASALSIDATGKTGILKVITTDAAEGVTFSGYTSTTGNANVGNLGTGGLITATGTITGGNLVTSGTLSVTGNTNLGNLTVSGTLQAGDIGVSSISNGTSNVDIVGVSGNVTTSVGGVANVFVITGTGANVNGYLSVSGNANVGNVGATTFVGNVTGGNISGNITTAAQANITSLGTLTGLTSTGTVNLTGASNVTLGPVGNVHITGGLASTVLTTDGSGNLSWITYSGSAPGGANTQIQFNNNSTYSGNANLTFDYVTSALFVGGNITGSNVSGGNLVSANYIAGTLTTGAQPNITSVGTITSPLIVQANINAANVTVPVGTISGNIISASGNVSGGNITTTGQIVSSLAVGTSPIVVTSTTEVANLFVYKSNIAGTVTAAAQSNITSVGILSSVSVSGNANIGNIGTGGLITATGNLNAGNIITAGIMSSTGNATHGNISTGGLITATGNISGGNINTAGQLVSTVVTGTAPLSGNKSGLAA